jgi:putative phosphotransacetylase
VEVSLTDARRLGIAPKIRMSGDLEGSPGAMIATPGGEINLAEGVIVAARHLHISTGQAKAFGLHDGEAVKLRKPGPREAIFGGFIVRSGSAHELEAHVDTDEANAAAIFDGDLLEIV